jgi:hypothetical protein
MCFSYVQGIHDNFIDLVGGSEMTRKTMSINWQNYLIKPTKKKRKVVIAITRGDVLVAQLKVHNFYTTKTHWWYMHSGTHMHGSHQYVLVV